MIFKSLIAACIALVIVEIIFHRHASFPWESWPGFYALWGFISLFAIVVLGKRLGRHLKRDESYYDD